MSLHVVPRVQAKIAIALKNRRFGADNNQHYRNDASGIEDKLHGRLSVEYPADYHIQKPPTSCKAGWQPHSVRPPTDNSISIVGLNAQLVPKNMEVLDIIFKMA